MAEQQTPWMDFGWQTPPKKEPAQLTEETLRRTFAGWAEGAAARRRRLIEESQRTLELLKGSKRRQTKRQVVEELIKELAAEKARPLAELVKIGTIQPFRE